MADILKRTPRVYRITLKNVLFRSFSFKNVYIKMNIFCQSQLILNRM